VKGGDEHATTPHCTPDLCKQRPVQKVEIADEAILAPDLEARRFDVRDLSENQLGDAPLVCFIEHSLHAHARCVDRVHFPSALREEDGVPPRAAGEIQRASRRDPLDRSLQRR
jgi:hypothetical protein